MAYLLKEIRDMFFVRYKILKISRLNDNVTEYNNAFNLMNIQFVTVHFLDSVIF